MTAPDPNELITYGQKTTGGSSFTCSRRTAAHLDYTKKRLAARAKKDGVAYRLEIIQGSYNTGVAASAGTHDFDAVLDVRIVDMPWLKAQRFLRSLGWAAWYRYPPLFSEHIHMISLGYTTKVGIYVPGQVSDYYAHKTGLVGHAPDPTWHPADIDATIFDYDRYFRRRTLRRQISRLGQRIKNLTIRKRRAQRNLEDLVK